MDRGAGTGPRREARAGTGACRRLSTRATRNALEPYSPSVLSYHGNYNTAMNATARCRQAKATDTPAPGPRRVWCSERQRQRHARHQQVAIAERWPAAADQHATAQAASRLTGRCANAVAPAAIATPTAGRQQIGQEPVVELHRAPGCAAGSGQKPPGPVVLREQRPLISGQSLSIRPGVVAGDQRAQQASAGRRAPRSAAATGAASAAGWRRPRRAPPRPPGRSRSGRTNRISARPRWVASRSGATETRVVQARCHHPPADRALQAAEREQDDAAPDQALRHPPRGQEDQERDREHHADQAAEQAVGPLPPVDGLEARQVMPWLTSWYCGIVLVAGGIRPRPRATAAAARR